MDSFRLVTLIRRLHLAIRAELIEELRAAGYHEITPAHIYVFQTPGPDGMRPTELAQRSLMSKQAMNHLLSGLEQLGYVERVPTPGDGRARVVQLTAEGRRLTRFIQRTSAGIEHRWEEQLGTDCAQAVRAALERLDTISASTQTVDLGSP